MNDLDRRAALHAADSHKPARGIAPLRRHRQLLSGERVENAILYALILANIVIWGEFARSLASL